LRFARKRQLCLRMLSMMGRCGRRTSMTTDITQSTIMLPDLTLNMHDSQFTEVHTHRGASGLRPAILPAYSARCRAAHAYQERADAYR
jgi:hypothetical protein